VLPASLTYKIQILCQTPVLLLVVLSHLQKSFRTGMQIGPQACLTADADNLRRFALSVEPLALQRRPILRDGQ
jgi:hypothetical protein